MADADFSKLNGQLAQAWTPGGSNAAATTHDLSNITHWSPASDCVFSYDNGDFDVAVAIPQGLIVGVPSDVKTLTLTEATVISYMRKNQVNG